MQEKSGALQIFDGLGDDDWLDVKELARRLGKSPQTINRYDLPHSYLGPMKIFRVGALRNQLLSSETKRVRRRDNHAA